MKILAFLILIALIVGVFMFFNWIGAIASMIEQDSKRDEPYQDINNEKSTK